MSPTTTVHRSNGSKPLTVRVGLYARVSTGEQTPENQLQPLRAFAAARGWHAVEFIDHGISGAKDRRPALDALLAAVRARRSTWWPWSSWTAWRAPRATW